MKQVKVGLCGLAIVFFVSGCATTTGITPQEKRQAVLSMKSKVLADLYEVRSKARAEIAAAPGYAVFSNANVYLFFIAAGGGYGVVQDNKTGRQTFMKMGEAGVGLGLGVKDFRAVFIFHNRAVMEKFISSGWEFGGQADAAAKASDKGAAVGGEAVFGDITIYELTESGLALQATVKGTKYWKDDDLN